MNTASDSIKLLSYDVDAEGPSARVVCQFQVTLNCSDCPYGRKPRCGTGCMRAERLFDGVKARRREEEEKVGEVQHLNSCLSAKGRTEEEKP